MATSITWARDTAFFKVIIIDGSGAIIDAPRQVALKVGGAFDTARQVLTLIEENGGSQSSTVASELRRNEQRVAEVLNLLKQTSSEGQVESLNLWLNEFLNYADALKNEIQEGTIHIVRSLDPPRPASYIAMFAPYCTPGGAMKPRVISDQEELRDFLGRELGVDVTSIDEILTKLQNQPTASLPNVVLSVARQRALGLL
jgi:hypothetical protein